MLETESGNLERPRLGTVNKIPMPRLHKGARNYRGIPPTENQAVRLDPWKTQRGPAFDGFLASEVYKKGFRMFFLVRLVGC